MDDIFKQFFKALTNEEKVVFAGNCETSVGYLSVSISRRQKFKAELCVLIELESAGKVTRKNLRPDDWMSVWPELVESGSVA